MANRTPISTQDVRHLSSGRWLISILATMSGENGSRFSPLTRRLGMSQSVLSRHLEALEVFGWIARNPGHGHPLRPEYVLTQAGRSIASWCKRVTAERARLGLDQHHLGRWSLPLLFELHDGWRRFSELERTLTPITPRALSLTLKQMLHLDLVQRRLQEPLLPLYTLTDQARGFTKTLLNGRPLSTHCRH